MKKAMRKLIAILSGFMLSAFSVVSSVPVNAENNKGLVFSEEAKAFADTVVNETNLTTTLNPQLTTTSTTTVPATTVTTIANPKGYDFDGTIFRGDYQWSYYLNDELDLSKLTFAVAIIDPRGDYRTDYVKCNFSYESGKYSDLYTLNTSEVDMSTPGKYNIYIRTKKGTIGDFETFKSDYLSAGSYKVRMDGHESYFTITVMDKERPVEIEDTDFRFVNHNGNNDCISITKGMPAAVSLYGYKAKELIKEPYAPSVFTFEIGDESIASLNTTYTRGVTVMLNGLEIGETTLTATAPNGKTATIKIIVHEYEPPVDDPQITTTTAAISTGPFGTTQTTIAKIDYRVQVEYDKSPMKIGEKREVKFYNPDTKTAKNGKVTTRSECISIDYEEGKDTFTVTALKEGKAEIYITAEGCVFGSYVYLDIISSEDVKGDANGDGTVDMADVVLIMQALANPNKYGINGTAEHHLTEQGKANADVDGDGLTVGDAQKIQMKLLGID